MKINYYFNYNGLYTYYISLGFNGEHSQDFSPSDFFPLETWDTWDEDEQEDNFITEVRDYLISEFVDIGLV